MNAFRIAVGTVIMAAGLGMASGTFPLPGELRSAPLGPVVKCQGACRIGDSAREVDTLINVIEAQCAAERTAAARCAVIMAAYEDKGDMPFYEWPMPLLSF